MTPQYPRGAYARRWTEITHPRPTDRRTLGISAWMYGHVLVVSALEVMRLPDGAGEGPQWHVSVSRRGRRPEPRDVAKALRDFGMLGAEEDNHHPGNARHFFLVVDPAHRVDCECKTDETVVADADGYAWTNPVDGPCRGCEIAPLLRRPCPLHQQLEVR